MTADAWVFFYLLIYQEAHMTEKPNSAEFADQRELAMLQSRRAGNPTLRMVPEISSARAAKTLTETDSGASPTAAPDADEALDEGTESSQIDYAATSDAILEALRKCKGNIIMSHAQKKEASMIINCPKHTSLPIVVSVILLIVSTVILVLSRRKTS